MKNVSIILGLRPFTSKANILPEQSVGRGLRLIKDLGPDYIQVLEIIGTDKFEEFVRKLETEGVGVGVTSKNPTIGVWVTPIRTRERFIFDIPVLSASFTQKMEGINELDTSTLPQIDQIDETGNVKEISVTLVTATTEKKVGTKQIKFEDDEFHAIQELLASLVNKILKERKFICKFNDLMRITKSYVRDRAFGKVVDLESLVVRRAFAKSNINSQIMTVVVRALGEHTKIKSEVKMTNYPICLF